MHTTILPVLPLAADFSLLYGEWLTHQVTMSGLMQTRCLVVNNSTDETHLTSCGSPVGASHNPSQKGNPVSLLHVEVYDSKGVWFFSDSKFSNRIKSLHVWMRSKGFAFCCRPTLVPGIENFTKSKHFGSKWQKDDERVI